MIRSLKKIKKFGLRRAFILLLIRFASKVRVFLYKSAFSDCTPSTQQSSIVQATQFIGKGRIDLEKVVLGVWPSPDLLTQAGYIEARSDSAKVLVKSNTFINNSFVIICDKSTIEIGRSCRIGPKVFITDSDFHSVSWEDTKNGTYKTESVWIGDNVFIGEGVKILKGTRIGSGTVIGSGSVVSGVLEGNCIYAGNPAKLIRRIEP